MVRAPSPANRYTNSFVHEDSNQLFGSDAIERTLSGVGEAASSEEIIKTILDDVRVFVGGAQQSDDLTMLVIRYLGRGDSLAETM